MKIENENLKHSNKNLVAKVKELNDLM